MEGVLRQAVNIKPDADKRPATIRAIRVPKRFEILAPNNPPMQKKLIAKVKVRASSEVPQPNSVAKGAFKIDHAYSTPANSIAVTPIARYNQRMDRLDLFIFINKPPKKYLHDNALYYALGKKSRHLRISSFVAKSSEYALALPAAMAI